MNREESQVVDQNAGRGKDREREPAADCAAQCQSPIPNSQSLASRWQRIQAILETQRPLLAGQGTIVASWRMYQGRRLGPYYRLAYREAGKQRSVYLGVSERLVKRVHQALADIQRRLRETQVYNRLKNAAQQTLRASKAVLRQQLAAIGIRLKGFEFRGIRAACARGLRRIDSVLLPAPVIPPTFVPPVPPSLRAWFWGRRT